MFRDIKPEYSITRVNKAGKNVRDGIPTLGDFLVIENWRASHNHILNAWQATLRRRCKKDKQIFFAQRLKRRKTIFNKLKREPTMALTKMHDIAGCRLIFKDLKSLYKYREELHKARFKHKRIKADTDPYNYISFPASSGYRGIHDVYKFSSRDNAVKFWDDLQVEIQYRTVYQHTWATAVEIAGALTGNYTKFDEGDEGHKVFFALASEIIARVYENSKSCYADLSDTDLVKRFLAIEKKTHLIRRLKNIKILTGALKEVDRLKGKNLILVANNSSPGLRILRFDSLPEATSKYFEMEKAASSDADIVLVRAESHETIRMAFKNYFADVGDFIHLIENGLKTLNAPTKEIIKRK